MNRVKTVSAETVHWFIKKKTNSNTNLNAKRYITVQTKNRMPRFVSGARENLRGAPDEVALEQLVRVIRQRVEVRISSNH